MAAPPVIGIVGSGPAADAVEAAAADVEARADRIDADGAVAVELPVVVGPAGQAVFSRIDRAVGDRWIAVELGGIGGRPINDVDAAVSVLDPAGGCFDCLRTRVRANDPDEAPGSATTTRRDARLAGAHAGRLAAGLVAGDVEPGRLIELPYAERQLLPVPGCRCTDPPARAVPRTFAEVSVAEAADRFEDAVDPRLGLVGEVGELYSFPAPYYLASLADTSAFSDAAAGPKAAGVAADWNAAFVKALGEALERYGAGVYRETAFDVAPVSEREAPVPPDAFVRPEGSETPAPDEPLTWITGESLHDGRSVSLPAELVVFPPPAHRFGPSITTGLGLGTSGAGAIRSGLSEVVERDATMLAWYSTFEPLTLAVDAPGYRTLARRGRAEDLRATASLVTQDIDVPVVTVAVHREGSWPRFAVGSGASLDPVDAAESALAEALQNWMELRGMGPDQAAEDASEIARYADRPPAVEPYVGEEPAVEAATLGPADPPTGAAAIDAVVDRLEAVGLEAFAARLTTPDLERLGAEVVRVLVPGAQPLFTGEAFFGERAETVPRELGFEPRFDRPPHPYP